MRQAFLASGFLAAFLTVTGSGTELSAQTADPAAGIQAVQPGLWLQIEAQPTAEQAQDRARAYAALFPNVAGFTMRSGWHAIAIGPFADRAAASAELSRLRREGLIPRDSFVADANAFDAPFWPTAEPAAPAVQAPAPEAAPAAEPTVTAQATPEAVPTPAPEPEVTALPPDPVVAEPEPEPEETPEQARAAEAALTADDRRALQTALQWFGHYASAIDGAFGPGTRKSMAAWQQAQGAEPTGVLTTAQRAALLAAHAEEQAALGLQVITEPESGIEIALPTALVEFDRYAPPFVQYRAKGDSGVKVVLISEPGDQAALFGLYDLLQTLEDVPLEGERSRSDTAFTIDAANGAVASHTHAELSRGMIKGYMLVWRPQDGDRIARVRAAMEASFRSVSDRTLDPGLVPLSAETRAGLLQGLEVRKPVLSRSGFYVGPEGEVVTTLEAVGGCNRITLDLRTEAEVVVSDAASGIALLKPKKRLSPPGVAELRGGAPRPGEVAVSGYSYEDRLPAPALTFGTLDEARGLDGEAALARLTLATLPGDAGGPVLDATGAVLGMLLPRDANAARRLPDSVAHALQAAPLATRLAAEGLAPRAAPADAAPVSPDALARKAAAMTVLVSCW